MCIHIGTRGLLATVFQVVSLVRFSPVSNHHSIGANCNTSFLTSQEETRTRRFPSIQYNGPKEESNDGRCDAGCSDQANVPEHGLCDTDLFMRQSPDPEDFPAILVPPCPLLILAGMY